MKCRLPRRSALACSAALLLGLSAAQTLTAVPVAASPQPGPPVSVVTQAEDEVARAVAGALSDAAWRARVQGAVLASKEAALTPLARSAGASVRSALESAGQKIATAKGLDGGADSLLQVRLGDSSMRSALIAGTRPWVTAASSDRHTDTLTAYDSEGHAHSLSASTAPSHPVYVVDIDAAKAVAAGLEVLNDELRRQGVTSTLSTSAVRPQAKSTASGVWTTRITEVGLADDHEPWVKGDAEIYTLVTGFGQDGKPRVDPVDMPYLDQDGTTYKPDQVLVNWSFYKYDLADAVMMEDDGDTNYRELGKVIATVLLIITDQGMYVPLANAVLDAIPDDWWTDEPDYVDSWYALSRSDNGIRDGARGNGWMRVEPYFVEQ
jgi:hypothetical protein